MDDRPRRRGAPRFALIALIAVVPVGYLISVVVPRPTVARRGSPPSKADAGAAAADAGARLENLALTAMSGAVEVRKGRGGTYQLAQLGARLAAEDEVRTGDGRATLTAGGSFEVQIESGTELSIEELNERLSRFELGSGMLVAAVHGAGHSLVVKALHSDAQAVARGGTFAMSSNGSGAVAVGARKGEVEFSAAGKAVMLRAGQQSIALGGAPQPPSAIPTSLFLKVGWPETGVINRSRITVSGVTAPGAVILVEGVSARVEKDGRFTAALELREGVNFMHAEGQDVGGHRVTERARVELDTTAPDSVIQTEKLWAQ
jgi:hypothetical protein